MLATKKEEKDAGEACSALELCDTHLKVFRAEALGQELEKQGPAGEWERESQVLGRKMFQEKAYVPLAVNLDREERRGYLRKREG